MATSDLQFRQRSDEKSLRKKINSPVLKVREKYPELPWKKMLITSTTITMKQERQIHIHYNINSTTLDLHIKKIHRQLHFIKIYLILIFYTYLCTTATQISYSTLHIILLRTPGNTTTATLQSKQSTIDYNSQAPSSQNYHSPHLDKSDSVNFNRADPSSYHQYKKNIIHHISPQNPNQCIIKLTNIDNPNQKSIILNWIYLIIENTSNESAKKTTENHLNNHKNIDKYNNNSLNNNSEHSTYHLPTNNHTQAELKKTLNSRTPDKANINNTKLKQCTNENQTSSSTHRHNTSITIRLRTKLTTLINFTRRRN